MTTLRDLITDAVKQGKDIKSDAVEKQRMQLDDDMQELEEIEEELENDIIESIMHRITLIVG